MYYQESATELTWELVNAASAHNPWHHTSAHYGSSLLEGVHYFKPTLNPRDFKLLKELSELSHLRHVLPLFREIDMPYGPVPALPELIPAEVSGLRWKLHPREFKKKKALGITSLAYGFADAFKANPKRDYTDLQAFYQGKPLFDYEEKLPILCALLDPEVRHSSKLLAKLSLRWDKVYDSQSVHEAMRIYTAAQRLGFEQEIGLTPKRMEHIADRLLSHMDSREDPYVDVDVETPIEGCTIGAMYRNLRVLEGGAKAAMTFGKEPSVPLGHSIVISHHKTDYRDAAVAIIRTRRFMRRLPAIQESASCLNDALNDPECADKTRRLIYLTVVVDEMEYREQEPDFSNVGAARYGHEKDSRREYISPTLALGRTHPYYTEARNAFSLLKDALDPVFTQKRLDEDSLSPSLQLAEEEPVQVQP
jgi:hypothetical protein